MTGILFHPFRLHDLVPANRVVLSPMTRGRAGAARLPNGLMAEYYAQRSIAEPEEVGNGGRIRWVSGRPGEAPAYADTDFVIAREGRITALYLFLDKLP